MAAKKITLRYDGKEYLLEFNRSTAQVTEQRGFVAKEIDEKPNVMIPLLTEGAFLAHHSNIKRKDVEAIFSAQPNKDKLIAALVEMYYDTTNSLMDSEGDEKNAGWEASW